MMQGVIIRNSEMNIEGTAIGLNDSGALLVQTSTGVSEVLVGDVTLYPY